MKPPFHLDSSALLAHFLDEPGYDTVESILERHAGAVRVSAVTWLEFRVRLRQLRSRERELADALLLYRELLGTPLPITGETADQAFALREEIESRLPSADALIAATARLHDAALVHRDPHLSAIPQTLVRQIVLPDK